MKNFAKTSIKRKDPITGKVTFNQSNLVKRHGGTLGLCAIVNSCPYDLPSYLPDIIAYLCQFINDPAPIQVILILFDHSIN